MSSASHCCVPRELGGSMMKVARLTPEVVELMEVLDCSAPGIAPGALPLAAASSCSDCMCTCQQQFARQ